MTLEEPELLTQIQRENLSVMTGIFFLLNSDVLREERKFNPIDFSGAQDPVCVILVCRRV